MADQPQGGGGTPALTQNTTPQGAGGAAPAQPAHGGSHEFSVPAGKMLVDEQEYRRNADRIRGMQSLYDAASKRGFKDPKAFERLDVLEKKGLKLDHFLAAIEAPEEEAEAEQTPQGISEEALAKILQKRGYLTRDELTIERAREQHKETLAAHRKACREWAKEVAPDATDAEVKMLAAYMASEYDGRRAQSFYPAGHPLVGEDFAPLNEEGIAAFKEAVRKERELMRGQAAMATAKATTSGAPKPPATAAGKSGGGGNPTNQGEDRRPGGLPSAAKVEAYAEQLRAKRGGGTVSSAAR